MNPATVLLLGVIAVLILAGSRLAFGKRAVPAWIAPFFATGAVFLAIGALIGPQGANLFTDQILQSLDPLIVIGIGWIGFLYGTHFEWRLLRRYPITIHAATLFVSLFTFALIAGTSWLLISGVLAPGLPWREQVAAAAILGVCGAGTAPAGVFQLSSAWRISTRNLNVLRLFAALDDLPPVLLLGLMNALLRPAAHGSPLLWIVYTIGLGAGLGMICHWLFPKGDDARHNFLILLGVVSLGAGAAAMLRLSPIFVSALAGMIFANLSPRKETAYGMLASREHTLYAIFLLMAGVLFRFEWSAVATLLPAFIGVRALGKLMGGYVSWRLFLARSHISPLIGAGLLFQGGMALAMAVSYDHSHGDSMVHQVTTTILVAVVINDLMAPFIAGGVLGARRQK